MVPVDPTPFTDITDGSEQWFLAIGSLEAALRWLWWMALAEYFEVLMTWCFNRAIGLSVWRGLRNCAPPDWWDTKVISARERLQVELKQWELAEAAERLAKLDGRLCATQDDKKAAAKRYKTLEDGIIEEMHNCAERIRMGEMRTVDVTITLDYRLGLRIKTRDDTGEIIEERPLTGEERQQDWTAQ